MSQVSRPSGLRIELPEGFALEAPAPAPTATRGGGRKGPRPLPGAAEPLPPLLAALAAQDLRTVDTLTLDLTPAGAAAVRSAARPLARTFSLSLDLKPDEGAAVLVEQDGVYAWHLPTEAPPAGTVRRRASPGAHEARFEIVLGQPAAEAASGPPGLRKRGFAADFIVGKVRAYVLKFAVNWALEGLMAWLERDIRTGFVDMRDPDPARWTAIEDLETLALPTDRPARILLFVHGTFSSTLGSYGALGGTAEGRALLRAARGRYDAVIGFDHRSLSQSPEDNARDLLARLKAHHWPLPPHLDVVSYSRGGLVYRALAELGLPRSDWRAVIDRVVFVAVPNAGTHLADPDNWEAMLDLYTNLAAAAGKVLGTIPALTVATRIFNETLKGLAALAKCLTTQGVTEGDVPGLAAMDPDGPFIAELNRIQPGQPGVDTTYYCAVTSALEVQILGEGAEPPEFPKRLAMALADRVADRLFAGPNDLVVDTASMTAIDREAGSFIKDSYHFGKNPRVYHTVYFAQSKVALALCRWLRLDDPDGSRARAPTGDWVEPGQSAAPVLSPEVDTRILVADASETLESLRDDLARNPEAAHVIVRRPQGGDTLDYAYAREEVESLTRGQPAGRPVFDGLRMHRDGASRSLSRATRGGGPTFAGGHSASRTVILDGGRPIGVVREADLGRPRAMPAGDRDLPDALDLEPAPDVQPHSATDKAAPAGPEPGPQSAQPPAPVQCHFYAEMPGAVQLGADATLLVSVSRETIAAAVAMAHAGASAPIDPARRIILDVRARLSFLVVGEARAEIDPPAPGTPTDLYFTVRPTCQGEGEVWVVARQGQIPLVTLKLRVSIEQTQSAPAAPVAARASTDEPAAPVAPLCQLRIFERLNGDEVTYQYDLEIPDAVIDYGESPPIRNDRGQYVKSLYDEIEQRWQSAQEDIDAFAQEMREMGGSLFAQLFPLKLQQALWTHRAAIRRIQVISTEPFVPWEIVHLKEPGQPLPDETLFLAQLGVVRWLHGSWVPSQVRIRKERARTLVPDYPHPDDKLPQTAVEADFLRQTFAAVPVEPHPLAVRALLRGPAAFDLLHFAGHGVATQDAVFDAQLQLEGRVENGQVIPEYLGSTAVEQQAVLRGADGNRPMVVLNACQVGRLGFRLTGMGGFAAAFLSRGAGIFVSTLWSVGDAPAQTFVVTLYERLLAGDELADSVIAAREAARAAGDASWLCYAVYGHPQARVVVED